MANGAGGRPSKYDDIDLKQVEKLARMGWTDIQMAQFFEVDVRTWHRWKGEHDAFCHSLSNWKDNANRNVERSLYERAMGYSCIETKLVTHNGKVTDEVDVVKHYPPEPKAQQIWLMNRDKDRWRDKQVVEHTGEVDVVSILTAARKRSGKDDGES